MIPLVKTSSVFTSRWKALLWAVPVIWFAYAIATSMPQSDDNSANSEAAATADTNKIPATWN